MSTLATISKARRALAKAKTLDDVLQIRDQAEAVRVYAKAAAEGFEAQNGAAEIKLRAERKAGELLKVMEKAKGGGDVSKPKEHRSQDVTSATLDDIGVTKMQSSRWQKQATVPEEVFEEHVAQCNEEKKELTQTSVLKLAGAGHVSQSTGENEWYTPSQYIELARKVMGTIDLDPASSATAQKTVKAKRFFTIAEDGLSRQWRGNVWLNPPYSKDLIGRFIAALVDSYSERRVTQAVLLVNNATETAWFQSVSAWACGVCFPSGRIKFNDSSGNPKNSPLQGQAFVYLGSNWDGFEEHFRDVGSVFSGVVI